jgi:hypothetical protein
MICKTCRSQLSDLELACVPCVTRRARESALGLQRNYVAGILSGDVPLRLSRIERGGLLHVTMFHFAKIAWCGSVFPPTAQRIKTIYTTDIRHGICEKCLAVFDDLVAAEVNAA